MRDIGDDLIAAGIGGIVGLVAGLIHGPAWVPVSVVAMALLMVGIVLRVLGRGEGLARLEVAEPAINPEVVSHPVAGGQRAGVRVAYARVRVTNTSRRLTATVRATITAEGLEARGLPLHWQHEREPRTIEGANITDNPPAILGPGQSGRLDLAIRFDDDGSLFAASILSYRAPWLRHEELRITKSPCEVLVDVSGEGCRPAAERFVLVNGSGRLAIQAA